MRSAYVSLGWTARDYVKRVWDNSGEDNVFFLAGGIAFNLLLAAVPFILLFAAGLGSLLNQSADASSLEINSLVDRFLPPHPSGQSPLAKILVDIIKSRQAI